MSAPASSLADQLADIVVCMHGMVEQLEQEEEKQELTFFQAERDAIERVSGEDR